MTNAAPSNALTDLQAENARLVALLEAHGIEWRLKPPPPVSQSERAPTSTAEKLALFRRLFEGRTDVFPVRWESQTTGKSGYTPACANDRRPGVCQKPVVKCGDCAHRQLLPVTDKVIFEHLAGKRTLGVYPLLTDDTCHFLAVDFDEAEWQTDAQAFVRSCRELGVPVALEVSRSGQGAHAWIFFRSRVSARDARRLGTALISYTCASTRQLRLASYDRLIRLAAFQNPAFYQAQAMRFSVWDKPRVIGCAENFARHIGLPRGCLDGVAALLNENGIRMELSDERHAGVAIDVSFTGTLRIDQEAAVAAMLHHDIGVLCAPTAFGKTVTAAAMIARRGVNTLILVHRTELMKQWQARLGVFLDVGKDDIGIIGGGKNKPSGRIDIAVMQSLSRAGEVNPVVENYGQVIVDECHHLGAVSFDLLLRRTKARYVLGLTATPKRRDGQQPIIFMQCGPIRYTAATPEGAPRNLEVIPKMWSTSLVLPDDAGIRTLVRGIELPSMGSVP